MYFLGLSQHHDSAAALLRDGQIVAFCEEERFSRIKHDGGFPALAVQWCLRSAGITLADVDHVAYFFQGRRLLWHAIDSYNPVMGRRVQRILEQERPWKDKRPPVCA